MKKQEKIIVAVSFVFVVTIIFYVIYKMNKQVERIDELEKDNFNLQSYIFEKYGDSEEVIPKELDVLIEKYSEEHPETVKNLGRVRSLYRDGNLEEAVRKMALTIENKFKLRFIQSKDEWFSKLTQKAKDNASLQSLIDRAKKISLIDDLQASILSSLRISRNGESHQEAYIDEKKKLHIYLLGGIDVANLLVPSMINGSNEIKLLD